MSWVLPMRSKLPQKGESNKEGPIFAFIAINIRHLFGRCLSRKPPVERAEKTEKTARGMRKARIFTG